MMPKLSAGEMASDFAISEQRKLSDLQGNYVLLDFWGSWCGPCIASVPNLKTLYQKYNGKQFKNATNFEIVGIAVEQKEKYWKAALNRLNVPWKYNVVDLATSLRFFDSPIANQYGVKEVPTKFLISPAGEIIGVNISFEEIDEILQSNLKL